MSAEVRSILEAALALEEGDRALIADQLLDSLEPPEDEITEEEFSQELERRYEEYLRDPSCAVPLSRLWDDQPEASRE